MSVGQSGNTCCSGRRRRRRRRSEEKERKEGGREQHLRHADWVIASYVPFSLSFAREKKSRGSSLPSLLFRIRSGFVLIFNPPTPSFSSSAAAHKSVIAIQSGEEEGGREGRRTSGHEWQRGREKGERETAKRSTVL